MRKWIDRPDPFSDNLIWDFSLGHFDIRLKVFCKDGSWFWHMYSGDWPIQGEPCPTADEAKFAAELHLEQELEDALESYKYRNRQ